jgi:hypothetical protein
MRTWLRSVTCAGLAFASSAWAVDTRLDDITITRLRAVGDYTAASTYDQTLEIWFNQPISYNSGSRCTSTFRVFIDARDRHLVATAHLAFATGKRININVDDNLPIRDGACQVSFLDLLP